MNKDASLGTMHKKPKAFFSIYKILFLITSFLLYLPITRFFRTKYKSQPEFHMK